MEVDGRFFVPQGLVGFEIFFHVVGFNLNGNFKLPPKLAQEICKIYESGNFYLTRQKLKTII